MIRTFTRLQVNVTRLVGVDEGLKHDSSVHCDEKVSLPKSALTDFIGRLAPDKMDEVGRALTIALDLG